MDEIYKYQKEIDEMLADGKVSMPELSPIEHLTSYRFVMSIKIILRTVTYQFMFLARNANLRTKQ